MKIPTHTNVERRRRWLPYFIAGIACVLAVWGVVRILYPPLDPKEVSIARRFGVNPRDFSDSDRLDTQIKGGEVSDADWSRMVQLFHEPASRDPGNVVQSSAVDAMMQLSRSKHRAEILAMTRPLLQNPDEIMRGDALGLLWKFHDPSWRPEAVQMLNDPDTNVRTLALALLKHGDAPP